MDVLLEICKELRLYKNADELNTLLTSLVDRLSRQERINPDEDQPVINALWSFSILEGKKDLYQLLKRSLPINRIPVFNFGLFACDGGTSATLNKLVKLCDKFKEFPEFFESFLRDVAKYPERYRSALVNNWSQLGEFGEFAIGALQFGDGELKDAFSNLIHTPLGFLCRLQAMSAMRRDRDIVQSNYRQFSDWRITAEVANAFFRLGKTSEANTLLSEITQPIRSLGYSFVEREAELSDAMVNKLMHRKSDIYSDSYSEVLWWIYYNIFTGRTRYQDSDCQSAEEYIGLLSNLLRFDLGIDCVIDFGVFCGYIIRRVASKFPNVSLLGIDRNPVLRDLNEKYLALSNLRYFAGDIIESLPELVSGSSRSVLFHSRTATLVFPEFLRTLYRECYEQGVEYIAFSEPIGISHTNIQFPVLSGGRSVVMRDQMFIHDYDTILKEAGYTVLFKNYWKLNQLLDHRNFEASVSLVAKKQ